MMEFYYLSLMIYIVISRVTKNNTPFRCSTTGNPKARPEFSIYVNLRYLPIIDLLSKRKRLDLIRYFDN